MSPSVRRLAGPALLLALPLLLALAACNDGDGSVTFRYEDVDCDGVEDSIDPTIDDADGDTWGDTCDNCPLAVNPFQTDTDFDELGNACDDDDDDDGIPDATDTCPLIPNEDQETVDNDGDGVPNACDNCDATPNVPHAVPTDCNADGDTSDATEDLGFQCDQDLDGVGDPCDLDEDGDGIPNNGDGNTGLYTPCDTGELANCDDNCPQTPNNTQADADDDGLGDACEGT